jgi:predicted TIM-barrel fold metal-dependent hydrolase
MIIDAHCHIGDFTPLFTGDHSAADLVAAHKRTGVDAGVVSILLRGQMSRSNDLALQACRDHPGHLYAMAYLDPHDPAAAVKELDRCAEHPEFRAVKLHPSEDAWFPYAEHYYPVYERISQLGLPALFHSGTYPHSNPLAIAYAAREFPQVPFILGHFALADLSWECFPAAALSDNVYVDTTANPMVRVLNEWIGRFGAQRMLWGSDFPFYDVAYEWEKTNHLASSDEQRQLIRGENAQRIFRL